MSESKTGYVFEGAEPRELHLLIDVLEDVARFAFTHVVSPT